MSNFKEHKEIEVVPCLKCGFSVTYMDVSCPNCGQKEPSRYKAYRWRVIALNRKFRKQIQHREEISKVQRSHPVLQKQQAMPYNRQIPQLSTFTSVSNSWVRKTIIICSVIFVVTLVFDTPNISSGLAPSTRMLYKMGATGTLPIENFRYWTPLTAIFLHGNVMHLLANLVALYAIGPSANIRFGHIFSLQIFFFSGITGFIFTAALGTELTLGSSGAVFGLMGALLVNAYHNNAADAKPILYWFAFNLIFALVATEIDLWAHVGGFISGALMAILIPLNFTIKLQNAAQLVSVITVMFIVIAFLLSVLFPCFCY